MGKYDALIPKLPVGKSEDEDPSRQEKVQERKKHYIDRNTVAKGMAYVALRNMKDNLNAQLKEVNLDITALEQLLQDSHTKEDPAWGRYGAKPNALVLADGSKIRLQPEVNGQVKDKEAFRLWCIANGYERQLQLWPSTANTIVKERILNGEPAPDGCEASVFTKVVFTKAKEESKDE